MIRKDMRAIHRGRKSSGQFLALPHAYLESPEYAALSPRALKALIDIAARHNGSNNGDLAAEWTYMRKRGWTSKDQLQKALLELIERGWLLVTRKGGRDREMPTLYAVTWWKIDPRPGKYDPRISSTEIAPHLWKKKGLATVTHPKPNRRVKICPAGRDTKPRHTGQILGKGDQIAPPDGTKTRDLQQAIAPPDGDLSTSTPCGSLENGN